MSAMRTSSSPIESGYPSTLDDAPVAVHPQSVRHKDLALRRAHIEDLLDGLNLMDDAVPLNDPTREDLEQFAGALDEEREEGE